MNPVHLLSTVEFSETQLGKLRKVASNLHVEQYPDAGIDDVPLKLRGKIEILYGWGSTVAEGHRYPNLKWVQTHSAGIDNLIDTPLWHSSVLISSLSGVHATPIAEHMLALILAFRWEIPKMLHLQKKAKWAKNRWEKFARPELRGSTLGIVGYGAIGRELARLASAAGMRVLAVNHSGQRRPFTGYAEPGLGDPTAAIPQKIYATQHLTAMVSQCDYVSVLAPLTPHTHHLINAQALAAMKPTAFLFNAGRGALVDEPALVKALQRGQIAGAGLDVFETEPLPAHSPLWQFDNVIISPHVAGFTPPLR